MNVKSLICSGFLHVAILGVGMTDGNLRMSPVSCKRPKAIEIEYIPTKEPSKSDDILFAFHFMDSITRVEHPQCIEIHEDCEIPQRCMVRSKTHKLKGNEYSKIEKSKAPSLSSKKTFQKRMPAKSVTSSCSTTKHDGYIPQLGNHLHLPPLIYPESAQQNQQEGELEIEISLNKNGCVRHVEVLKSANVPLLDQAAIDTYQGKCIVSRPDLFAALHNQKLILPIRFYLQ